MTRISQLEFVRAELAEIRRIEAAGGTAAIGMATRQTELEAEKRELEASIARLAAAELTFAGDPVVGSRAIRADFAAPALQAFEKAVIALAAAKERRLSARARLPGRAQNKLFVTSMAHGSFGFVLEELEEDVAQQGTLDIGTSEQSPLAQAMQDVQSILESSRAADDDLAESLLDVDPRAISLLRGFAETLMRHRALCSSLAGIRVDNCAQVSIANVTVRSQAGSPLQLSGSRCTSWTTNSRRVHRWSRCAAHLPGDLRSRWRTRNCAGSLCGWMASNVGRSGFDP